MPKAFGKTSTEQLNAINPILKTLAIKTLEKSTVDFGVPSTGGKRTAAEQKILFDKGFSQKDGTIKKSYHQSGNAVDLVPYIDGGLTWENKQAFHELHRAATEAWAEMGITEWTLTWGGDWKTFIDLPHYQLDKKK
jgi:peptidoglycan L-alanyl-D-glutamate endopeptidase CwlK